MKKCNKKKGKSVRSFQPDVLATAISGSVRRDLSGYMPKGILSPTQMYSEKMSAASVFCFRQSYEILKKYSSQSQDGEALDEVTYGKFFTVCAHLDSLDTSRFFSYKRGCHIPRSDWRSLALARAQSTLSGILCQSIDIDEWFQECRNSSGSSVGVSYADTSLEAKMSYPLSGTEQAVRLFRLYLEWDPQLEIALQDHNKFSDKPRYSIVEGSRATTVDKDDKIRRMIAIEPTLNMFFQQGLMRLMYKRMKSFGLDLSVLPDEHKIRARTASITGNEATIDFSSASDCVLADLVKRLLPPVWYECIMQVRCEKMFIKDEYFTLPMVSTMGNACTFPLETLIFFSLAKAVESLSDGSYSQFIEYELLKNKSCSVFGDDCIVPTQIANQFIDLCEWVGFLVNKDKSFIDRDCKFRESCGGDYYDHRDVRPFFLKAPSGTRVSDLEAWLYIITNRLLEKYISYFGPLTYVYQLGFLEEIRKCFVEYGIKVCVVPNDYPDDSGLKILDDYDRIERLLHGCYIRRLKVNRHGTLLFNFIRWVYPDPVKRNPLLRAWSFLKYSGDDPIMDLLHHFRCIRPLAIALKRQDEPKEDTTFSPVRRKGGYVVARGVSIR